MFSIMNEFVLQKLIILFLGMDGDGNANAVEEEGAVWCNALEQP